MILMDGSLIHGVIVVIYGYVWLYILLYMVRLFMRNLETWRYIPMNVNQQRLINSES